MSETDEAAAIEARKKKAERGWIVEPERTRPGFSPGKEIGRWYAVIGLKGSASGVS